MKDTSLSTLILCLLVLLIASIGGMAITWKVAGEQSSISFLYFSASVATGIFIFQLIVFIKARTGLFFELIFIGSISLAVIWFVLSTSLPILWMRNISPLQKWMIVLFFFLISLANTCFGIKITMEKWQRTGIIEFERLFDRVDHSVDWDKVIDAMKITLKIYIPGMPERYTPLVSIGVIGFMLAGLSLRNVLPVFSVFSWGVPALIVASFFFQVGSCNFSQAYCVMVMQNFKKAIIKSRHS